MVEIAHVIIIVVLTSFLTSTYVVAYIVGDTKPMETCAYTFQIWRPGEDILERIRSLESLCTNLSSTVDHRLLKLQNGVVTEILNTQNVTHRLEKDLLEQKLQHVQQEIEMKDIRLVLYDVRTETRKLWQAMNMLQSSTGGGAGRAPGQAPLPYGVGPSVDVEPHQVLSLESDLDRMSGLVGQLKNSVGDLKAEWLLIKREVNDIKAENLQTKFMQNDLKADIVRLKSSIEGLKSQTNLLRNQLDDVSAVQQSLKLDHGRKGTGAPEAEMSRLRNDLIELRTRADWLENEIVRLASINDDIRNEALDVLGGQRNISVDDIVRLLQKMASLSTAHEDKRKLDGEDVPKDCHDVYTQGYRVSGVYQIKPEGSPQLDDVYCEMVNHTGWTLLMRRQDGTVRFTKGWLEYQHGFGSLYGEFWLGNEKIHKISKQKRYRLRIDLWDWEGGRSYAEYDTFSVGSEATKYKLRARDYSGNAGDSLSYHDDMAFSTEDSDNDLHMLNCAETNKGGWWFNSCYSSNLNGLYRTGWYTKSKQTFADGIVWYTLKESEFYSLRRVEMKVRPLYLV